MLAEPILHHQKRLKNRPQNETDKEDEQANENANQTDPYSIYDFWSFLQRNL